MSKQKHAPPEATTTSSAMPAPGKQLLTVKDVAAKLKIDWRTFLRWADMGKAPWGLKIVGARRWLADEIDNWIANGCEPVRIVKGAAQ